MVKCWQSYSELQATEFGKRIVWHQTRKQTRSGHEMRGLSRVSRIMSRVTISDKTAAALWQCLGCQTSNDTLLRWHALSSDNILSLDAALTLGYYRLGRVLKDKFIVATFLRTSLLKISVELCFILPWINWISESSLRVHHAAWTGFCWLIFVADPGLRCLIVSWLYAVRPVRRGLLISWFNQSELGILTSINSDSWSV